MNKHLKPCVCGHSKYDHDIEDRCVDIDKMTYLFCSCLQYRQSAGNAEMDAWYAAGMTEEEAMQRD